MTNENIDHACESIEKFLVKCGVDRREILRAKLTFEELLLNYQAEFGEEADFELRCARTFPAAKVEVVVEGASFDPFSRESAESDLARGILEKIGLAPTWSYKKGKNYVVFIPKRKPISGTVKMAAALALSIAVGGALNFMPDAVRVGVNDYILSPLTDTFMGLIYAMSGPLVFLSVLGSIISMGNIETVGRIGSRIIKVILLYSAAVGALMTAVGCLFYPIEWGGGEASSFKQVLELVFDIVPSNLFEPFVTGNALQLVFIAVMVGLALLVLSSRTSGICSLVDQFNSLIQTMMMMGLSSVFPLFIFVLFAELLSNGSLATILSSWKMFVVYGVLCITCYAALIIFVSIKNRVSPFLILKKAMPTFLIALTTGSSGAAFSTNVRDANEKLGISKYLVGFATPIGQVLFKPAFIATLFAVEATMAQISGVPITLPWLVIGYFTNLLLSYAVPPILGGGAICFTIVFAQLGISIELMGIAIAANIVMDFLVTAIDCSSWQITVINAAGSLDMLDREVLRKDV